ncbi:glutathione S-transferase [Rhodobacterales bacterium HKCCE2091]|nr:glutathione S-transferase [Rhodobacterales bacterium HKCCE2091]
MTLFASPASPYVRKVRVVLLETGQDDVEIRDVATTPLASDPSLVAAAPLARIPVLVRDDGPAIFDSRVICRYLDARAGAGLYPEARLWEVLTLEALAEGIIDSALLTSYENRFRPEEIRFPEWLDAQWAKIARGLDTAAAQWMSHLAGPLNMGQIALGCALGYIDFRIGHRNWRDGRADLADWYERFSQRPSMTATEPPAS